MLLVLAGYVEGSDGSIMCDACLSVFKYCNFYYTNKWLCHIFLTLCNHIMLLFYIVYNSHDKMLEGCGFFYLNQ